ncbi:Dynein heavy chain 1, axonemal, related [Neospora caninum Liverpool]|uniref:Dynein heavy chain 1, axonemal, related n=1 Tax=Neospora caninum (strain Liverpool) TaxID=572307 RepID=F0VR23_NEOCL|nr:Dynein heavy chain 1, axonemal, related [Neospora caninum Liverpool]CBZ56170.1 Dynein heavy chain 1, axonemal, related [Neospora caninum Liverpool]|eukprot:XP_003886196.1 Dynein heavy chain 1, axonemal, related [Neospora caninum Liverpool]
MGPPSDASSANQSRQNPRASEHEGSLSGASHQSSLRAQRGIYSEVLRPTSLAELQLATRGPSGRVYVTGRNEIPFLPVGQFRPTGDGGRVLAAPVPHKVADVKPKVIEPFEQIPTHAPRKVTVERRRRLYASLDIEELLAERGINYADPQFDSERWLPLDPFDDTTYDDRLPEEWMLLGYDEQGQFLPLEAKGLRRDEGGSGTWKDCHVYGYDGESHTFSVRWVVDNNESEETAELLRMQLLFKRCLLAFGAPAFRRWAESLIKYNYYIDNMPTEDIKALESHQEKRIAAGARNMQKIRQSKKLPVKPLLKEINLTFARTMNKIAFDKHMHQNRDDQMYRDLELPPRAVPRPPPEFGLVATPPHDFTGVFAAFCISSLYVKAEVIHALTEIRSECNAILTRCIYNVKANKAMKLEEFKQTQRAAISQLAFDLQETWAQNVQKIVVKYFSEVGKGWFDIYETNKETYNYGKIRKMLLVASFLMQDSLRSMTVDSLEAFTRMIEARQPEEIRIESVSQVNAFPKKRQRVAREGDASGEEEESPETSSLFVLDLARSPGDKAFQFSVSPTNFLRAVIDIFEKGIVQMGDVPHPEKLVLPHLFKNQPKHVLASVSLDERKVQEYRRRIEEAMAFYLPHLECFLALFDGYLEILHLNPEETVQQIEQKISGPSASDQLKQMATEYFQREAGLMAEIPDCITIGAFCLNCCDVKRFLAQKLHAVGNLILDVIAQRFRDQCTHTLDQFRGLFATLKKRPRNIEELTETKAFIGDIPAKLERLAFDIKTNLHTFAILEDFKYKLYVEDHNIRWKMFGSPLETLALVADTERSLEKDRQAFLEELLAQQAEFEETVKDLEGIVSSFSQYADMSRLDEIRENVVSVNARIETSVQAAKLHNTREMLFGKPVTDYSRVHQLAKDFAPFSTLWLVASDWAESKLHCHEGPFEAIDAALLEKQVYGGIKQIHKVTRTLREKGLDTVLIRAESVLHELEDFAPLVPLIVALRNEGMRDRHWEKVSEAVGTRIGPGCEDFRLNHLLDLKIADFSEFIVATGELAAREYLIEKSLKKMKQDWEGVAFKINEKYKATDTYILKGTDEILALLDDHVMATQTLQFSSNKKPFEQEIEEWTQTLMVASETLDEWLKCQRSWMYLQPIFDSPDIMKQLPAETKRFKTVDTAWRVLMRHTCDNPLALAACSASGLLDKLKESNKNLDKVTHGLESYLELKRSLFARFYFLSNDELLEILSETQDPTRVQPFLCKVFENMDKLDFDEGMNATAMFSAEGEKVALTEHLSTYDKNVETWMGELETLMRKSVRRVLQHATTEYSHAARVQWVQEHPGQAVLNGSQIHWTEEVEEAIRTHRLREYLDKLNDQLMDLVALVRGRLDKMQSITVGALIVIDVHAKDVVEKLADTKVDSVSSFEWIAQLRYYWRDEDCWIQCLQTDFPYGYEYLGNTFRLVITPLTDMCYMTLLGAQQLNLGGAPAGPAGTGKTETTKDLAKAVARQCVVFNCSDMMDYIMVGKFFKGLASSGAWCCFDEFNRINIEVLSVIAQQLLVLFGAKAQLTDFTETTEIEFEGSEIVVFPTFNVFITMNPGYAGRTELPDNLKALFRPMAMMVPDYGMIGEIMLYSFGFERARELARKMVTTFKLSSEQLSAQDHYDYGMRAVRSVINAAGVLKRKAPEMDEQQLLLLALRDVNVPKFLTCDLPLFENIIVDLFPGVPKPEVDRSRLLDTLRNLAAESNLQAVPSFLEKLGQLYDTVQVRHGLMLVGPTGGGKTTTYRLLARAMTALRGTEDFQNVHIHALNPKALTLGQLYGQFNASTHEWNDGVAAVLLRQAVRDTSLDKHWIMFDGPVDAIWIESMNSVLDDNKKLCLNSGEIIAVTNRVTMMFEVEDLASASPATVSRCGMVYMEPAALGLRPLMVSWVDSLPSTFSPRDRQLLWQLFESFMEPAIAFVRKHCKEPIRTVDNNLCASCMRLLDCLLAPFRPTEDRMPSKETLQTLYPKLTSIFFFALTWSVGSTTDTSGRQHFSAWLLSRVVETQFERPLLPDNASLYDACFHVEAGKWMLWEETRGAFAVPRDASYEQVVVPTPDSIRMTFVFQTLLQNQKHVLCAGPTGTGKTVNLTEYLYTAAPDNFETIAITFSAQTHDMIDGRMEKRRRGVFGPPAGKVAVVFVDDLNMPRKEEFGAQPPLELLRQWCDHKGWYDRKSLAFFEIVDTVLVGAMAPPGGGRTEPSHRVLRHFNLLTYTALEDASVATIFTTLMRHFFSPFAAELQSLTEKLVLATTEVFNTICRELLPTPSRSHYTFNLREIWKVFQGMTFLSPKVTRSKQQVVKCWVHETSRVFGDRLVNDEDRLWLRERLLSQTRKHFDLSEEDIFTNERLVFADFCNPSGERLYEEVTDLQRWRSVIEAFISEYNAVNSVGMHLVAFFDACEHVSRICRILRQPAGHALLLGVRGSGRQSLSRLASFIMDCDSVQIEVVKGYGMNEWRDDLRSCFLRCGLEEKVQTFLLEDSQVTQEAMMEDMNNVLSYGDLPNLYKKEDLEEIISQCKGLCSQMGMHPTKVNIFNAYLRRVKANLHVILAMSPVGDQFRTRLRMFPALTNCCTIDWFSEWPAEALMSVARIQLENENLSLPDQDAAISVLQFIHRSAQDAADQYLAECRRPVFVTPTCFLELLRTLTDTVKTKQLELTTIGERFEKGLGKLEDAARQVEAMQAQLQEWQPVLIATSEEVEQKMVQIQKDRALADETKVRVAQEDAEASQKAAETQALKDDAQRDLDEALPAFDQAVECLKKLKAEHVREVPPVKKPDPSRPGGKIEDYWESAQHKLLKDPKKLLDDLLNYDKDNIPDTIIARIAPYIDRQDFDPVAIRKASVACEAICMWVRAMVCYYNVAKAVEPKRAKLRQAEEELRVTTHNLNVAKARLQEVESKIARLAEEFAVAMQKKEQLTADIKLCQVKVNRAQPLLLGLSDERQRWTEQAEMSKRLYALIPGHAIVSAGMIAYGGPFTAAYRVDLEASWFAKLREMNIPHTPGCNLRQFLGDPVKIRHWTVAGLPKDELSIENGIIIDRSRRWPLMIDPQTQANRFIKNMGKASDQGFETCKLTEGNFLREIELAVQFGKWVLIENVTETLDPSLEPIFLQQKIKDSQGWCVRLNDKLVPWSPHFKLFMTTANPNPRYPPEVFAKLSVLNFSITPDGLEEQMLGLVVSLEAPELEEKKNALVVNNAKMKKELKSLEDKILQLLSQSQGNILEDEVLINTLAASKRTAAEINQKVKEAEVTEQEIDRAREWFCPVAFRASLLFFCVVDLANIEPMYQYSLQWFQALVALGIEELFLTRFFPFPIAQVPATNDKAERLQNLSDYITYLIYENVSRSLFERHKILFAFSLALKIQAKHPVNHQELRFLLTGPTGEATLGETNPTTWLSEKQWEGIRALATLPAFSGLDSFFLKAPEAFKAVYDAGDAHEEPFPDRWNDLTPIQKMCILRLIRSDKLIDAAVNYVASELGQRFVDPPTFDLARSYKDSTNVTPLIFILSQGSDPVANLLAFAKDMNMGRRLESIALGQGQGAKARKLIEEACSRGGWVILQNCHLAASWMAELEKICEGLNQDVHRDFRLWLSSMPSRDFPVSILQNGVKMTNEPPTGLRANLLRLYAAIDDRTLDSSKKPEEFRRLMFAFCFFHAIVQDRRKFGPIGWNIQYEFTTEDLVVCQRQLRIFLDSYNEVPYKVLIFLGAKINYGGRVTDDHDKRLIECILKSYVNERLIEEGPAYKFSSSGLYYCPDAGDQAGFVKYVQSLPMNPNPEAFGLHENANINFAQIEGMNLLNSILSMAPRSSGGGGKTREQVVEETASQILEKLVDDFNIEEIQKKYPTRYEESMNTVLTQDAIRYNGLLRVMKKSIVQLQMALKGRIVMTEELDKVADALFDNQVPKLWAEKGFLSMKPLSSWTKDLHSRISFIQDWIDNGVPVCFWMSGLFFPQAFLTGVLQNYARMYGIAVDRLVFDFKLMDDLDPATVTERPHEGCYVNGIFLEGSRWDRERHLLVRLLP